MDLPVLDPQEQRVLGALMEKELTVPASYPLTLNSLRLACNQSTSRDPVVDYSENELVEVTLRLQARPRQEEQPDREGERQASEVGAHGVGPRSVVRGEPATPCRLAPRRRVSLRGAKPRGFRRPGARIPP